MSMVSPVKGYASSEFGARSGKLHAGIDIATGGVAAPVYAAYAGVLSNIVRGRKRYQPATVGPVVAPGRSGDGGRVHNPDGEQQIYIHTRFLDSLQNGDRVIAGQLLGYVNLSGNTSGYHLHFECWDAKGRLRNPRVDFNAFGIKVGSAPKKISTPAKKWPHADLKATDSRYDAWGTLLASVGYKDKSVVLRQQKWLRDGGYYKGNLDGKWGELSTRALQSFLYDKGLYRNGKNSKATMVDGKHGARTLAAEIAYLNQQRHYLI